MVTVTGGNVGANSYRGLRAPLTSLRDYQSTEFVLHIRGNYSQANGKL